MTTILVHGETCDETARIDQAPSLCELYRQLNSTSCCSCTVPRKCFTVELDGLPPHSGTGKRLRAPSLTEPHLYSNIFGVSEPNELLKNGYIKWYQSS